MLIYCVFSCDEWKSHDSMRLMFASTSVEKTVEFIKKKIIDDDFAYTGLPQDKESEANQFESDCNEYGINHAFSCLTYGYVEIVADGEEL